MENTAGKWIRIPCNNTSGAYLSENVEHAEVAYLTYSSSKAETFGGYGKRDSSLPAFIQAPDQSGIFIPSGKATNNEIQACVNKLMPIIKAEISLPNFLYELKDFRRPVLALTKLFNKTSFKEFLKKISKLAYNPKDYQTTKWGHKDVTFRFLAQNAASLYLEYRFNFAPLVSDIHKLYLGLSRTRDRIADLLDREAKPQRKHMTVSFMEFGASPVTDQTTTGGYYRNLQLASAPHRHIRTVIYEPSKLHVEIQYNYNYTEAMRQHALLLGFLDSLGVNLNPQIIWNAVPYTFIIDWVLGISKSLGDYKLSNLRPVINIQKSLWSITRARTLRLVDRREAWTPRWPPQETPLPNVYETAYRRDVNFVSSSSLTTSGLSLDEFSLGAALLIARRRH